MTRMTNMSTGNLDPYIQSITWAVEWCKAFPMLVSLDVYCAPSLARNLRSLAWENTFSSSLGATSSGSDLENVETWTDSLGYGEILSSSVFKIMEFIDINDLLEAPPSAIYDLGSGNGRVLLAASFYYTEAYSVGLEIVPGLHQEALQYLREWNIHAHAPKVEFTCGDFTLDPPRIQEKADMIICHATVFGDVLFDEVENICEGCRTGTIFILVSRPLKKFGPEKIETLGVLQMSMSWGSGAIFVQRRK